jgi:CHAT domain-containing protein
MREYDLLKAVRQLVNSRTPDEGQAVLERDPELRSQESIDALRVMARAAIAKGDQGTAQQLQDVADWLDQLNREGGEAAGIHKSVVELVQQLLSGSVSIQDAIEKAQSAEISPHLNDEALTTMDEVVWGLRERGNNEGAVLVAWLNFRTAHIGGSEELRKWTVVTLLQVMPATPDFAKTRETVCATADKWFNRSTDPELWAGFMVERGNALRQIRESEREENIEHAIQCYCAALEVRTPESYPVEWAETMTNLGTTYLDRIRGERAENIEQAIECLQALVRVLDREAFPAQVATAIAALGAVLLDRMRGERADNIEHAIECLQDSIQVHTREAFPREWARAMNNLGVAYDKRIRGETSANVERAIEYYQQALGVMTMESDPYEWSRTLHNLGIAHSNRTAGDPESNIKKAIELLEASLHVRTRRTLPLEWAKTKLHLGSIHLDRTSQQGPENIERAIECFRQALEVLTSDTSPAEWAAAMTGLGTGYYERIRGDAGENIDKAIDCFQAASRVYTHTAFPREWVGAAKKLAASYIQRVRGAKAENIELAINHCLATLQVLDRKAHPKDWATIVTYLGLANLERIRGDRADNLESGIALLKEALEVYERDKHPREWASTNSNLALAYCERIRGDKAANVELAIACLEESLQVQSPDLHAREWAGTARNLGLSYIRRVLGEKKGNIEDAIRWIRASLEVFTREHAPGHWAVTMDYLGVAYLERTAGDRGDNVEQAIQCFNEALGVKRREAFPQDWASITCNLGTCYSNRILGKTAENLEQAIECYKATLEINTRESHPVEWASAMYSLGNAFKDRIRGDRAANIEQAIECYKACLEVRTRDAFSEQWARTMNSLAAVYSDRVFGKRVENLEMAIELLSGALDVCSRDALPREWARQTHDLGASYRDRLLGEKPENTEKAIEFFKAAATVHTHEALPFEWAFEMYSLGSAYIDRSPDDAGENVELAIQCYRRSLEVYTRGKLPLQWARTMHKLGAAYTRRVQGDRDRNLSQAVECLTHAADLEVELSLPIEAYKTMTDLGNAFFSATRYQEAARIYLQALDQVELVRAEVLSLDRRADVIRATAPLFERTIISLIKSERYLEALCAAERGTSRRLNDLLSIRDVRPKNVAEEVVQRYENLLFESRELEDVLRDNRDRSEARDDARQRQMERVRREFNETQQRLAEAVELIRGQDPDFLPHSASLTAEDITVLARESNSTLAEFRVTELGSFVFLVFPEGGADVVVAPEFTSERLESLLVEFENGKPVEGFVLRYYQYQIAARSGNKELAQRARQVWLDCLDQTLGRLYDELMAPVHRRLKTRSREGQTGVEALVIVPNRGLAILPLHACWWAEGGKRRYLLDDFVIRTAPSLSVFRRCLERDRAGGENQNLLAIANPAPPGNLEFSEWECREIERLLGAERCRMFWRETGTRDQVIRWAPESRWLHFSCHGKYRIDAPLESSLALAEGTRLTLGEIFGELHLRQTWLTVLSACETGLVDFREIADEHYGLPMGFLFAGSCTVWATLWTVNDKSTALLMARAYEGLILKGRTKAEALRDAQVWLRDATVSELKDLLARKGTQLSRSPFALTDLVPAGAHGSWGSVEPSERRFSHPYFWAGLQSFGA